MHKYLTIGRLDDLTIRLFILQLDDWTNLTILQFDDLTIGRLCRRDRISAPAHRQTYLTIGFENKQLLDDFSTETAR